MENNNVTKQELNDGLERVIEENNKSNGNLAKMIKEGFDEQGRILTEHGSRLNSLEQGQNKLEQGQDKLEQGQEEIKMRLDNKADRFEVGDLSKRVMRIEDIVLRRKRLVSKF